MLKSILILMSTFFLAHHVPKIQRKKCKDMRKNLTNMITSKLEERVLLIDKIVFSPTCDCVLNTGFVLI